MAKNVPCMKVDDENNTIIAVQVTWVNEFPSLTCLLLVMSCVWTPYITIQLHFVIHGDIIKQ
jgi:hypothetical protein